MRYGLGMVIFGCELLLLPVFDEVGNQFKFSWFIILNFGEESPVNKLCSYERVYKKNPSSYSVIFSGYCRPAKLEGNHKIEPQKITF